MARRGIMDVVAGILILLVVIAVGARVHSRLRPMPFPPWLTPILEAPWRNRERIVTRCGIAAGERLLEVGPGAGWITETALRALGPGRAARLPRHPDPDPDYIRPQVLGRLLRPEGFEPKDRFGTSLDYVQRFARP